MKTSTVKNSKSTATAPAMPALSLTDPARKLTRAEWKGLTVEQKRERKANRRAARGPETSRYARSLVRMGDRIQKLAKAFHSTEGTAVGVKLSAVLAGLKEAAVAVTDLPDSWTPAHKHAGGRADITKGSSVTLVEKKQAEYASVLNGDEAKPFTVESIVGKRGVYLSASGIKMFLPTAHVRLAKVSTK